MEVLAWTQGGFAVLLFLVWIYLLTHPVLTSVHKHNGKKVKVQWDPKARRRFMWILLISAVLNAVCALLGYLLNSATTFYLFFAGVIIAVILIFLITFFAERDNLSRLNNRE